ncbi:MAG: flagellar basal body P-ring formation protein FlgA [Rhodocyclaceae bacterium]|jgi:flagella basal body P-ring formation protein FlgA|nr:flagellar basal body P-ring formation protein FlgA [Rhodocyclaceae bacterium]
MKFVAALLGLLSAFAACAAQDPAQVKLVVEDFLRIQTRGLPGKASIEVRSIDPNNQLAPCVALEAALASGARAWGRTTVQVRCHADPGWQIYVQAQVRVQGSYLVATRSLSQGQVLGAQDVMLQSGDLTDLPATLLTDPQQAIGRSLAMPAAAGRPLRSDLLRQTPVVQQGQNVKVISRGAGFQVANEGQALNSASEGQVVRVRLNNGQMLSGIAKSAGIVEVSY